MSYKKVIIYLSIVCLSVSCVSKKVYNETITVKKHNVEDLKQDVDLAYQVLKDGHPGLYWYISKEELHQKYDSVRNAINEPLTTAEFYQKLAPLIAAIKCGHTSLKYPSIKFKGKKERELATSRIPSLNQFSYYFTPDDRLFILNNKSKNEEITPGTELLEIEGKAVADIVKNIEKSFSYDGYNSMPRNRKLESAFPQFYKIYYGEKDSLFLKFKTDNNQIIYRYVRLLNTKKEEIVIPQKKTAKNITKQQTDSIKYRGKKSNGEYQLDFKFLDPEKEVAYLKIKSFSIPTADFDAFYKQCFDNIAKVNAKNLVIDLRNNLGGTLNASMSLFAYLTDKDFVYLDKPIKTGNFNQNKYGNALQRVKYYLTNFNDPSKLYEDKSGNFYSFLKGYQPQKPKKNNFKGKVYVLINEFSYSASSLLSANLKGIKRATFVGKETGGGANQCTAGALPIIELKHSKLALRLGLNRMAPVYQQEVQGRGVFPDVVIETTLKDRLTNHDNELDWVLKDIKKKI